MTRLTVLLIVFFCATAASFTQKSECLIQYSEHQEGEYEAEENEDENQGGGGSEEEDRDSYHGQTGHGFREHTLETGQRYPGWSRGYNRQYRRGYLDEEGEWEDRKRRRKRGETRQELKTLHTHDTLVGQLSCGTDSVMHVLNVTVGYSNTQQCYQASPGCQAGSSLAKQVIHCQGNNGVCDITIGRHFMIRCGHETNFALVVYECIPATKLVDICSSTNTDISDALALTSSNYPNSSIAQPSAGSMDIITCECTLRASAGSHLELEYIRTHLPMTGATCEGDLLLLERPDLAHEGRYLTEREICGHNVSNNVVMPSNVLRVSFLTGAPLNNGKSGFLAKFKALSTGGTNVAFHLSCIGTHSTSGHNSLVTAAAGRSVLPNRKSTTSIPIAPAKGVLGTKVTGRTLPPNFDPFNLSANLLNLTRDELQARLLQSRLQSQKIVGVENDGSNLLKVNGGPEGNSLDSSSSGGVLSGVVASLSSVVLIMGSLGAFIFYRRHQKRKHHQEHHQHDLTTPDVDSLYEDDRRNISPRSVLPVKNQNRPLPNPHSIPGVSTTSAGSTARQNLEPDRAAGKIVSKLVKTGREIPSSSSESKSSDDLYSIAGSVPDPAQESAGTVDAPSLSLRQAPNVEVLSHTHTPSSHAQSTPAPIAPARSKRKKSRHLHEISNYYMSPYDNAGNISTGEEAVLRSHEDRTNTTTSDSSPAISRESGDQTACIINRASSNNSSVDLNPEYGDYSSLHDIQLGAHIHTLP